MLDRIALLAGMLLLATAGCGGGVPFQDLPLAVPTLVPVAVTNYAIGTRLSATVGAPMVSVKRFTETHSPTRRAVANATFRLSSFQGEASGSAGTGYPVIGRATVEGREYAIVSPNGYLILADSAGVPLPRFFDRVPSLDHVGVFLIGHVTMTPDTLRFVYTTSFSVARSPFHENYELVYGGTTGTEFRVAYREYSPDDLIRPAFTQELTYPQQSATIRFRDLQIAVHAATSEQIEFTVTSDGH